MSETLKYPTPAHGNIPSFQSYEEEARFWDTHDFTDFSKETQPVNVRSTSGLTKQLMIRLDEETDHILEAIAAEEDMKKSALVRKILKAWLHQQRERHAS
jgi:hypothetical protein